MVQQRRYGSEGTKYSRQEFIGKLTSNVIHWVIEIGSVPFKFVGALIIIMGRLLSTATSGGKATLREDDSTYHVLLNTLIIASFSYSAYQWGGWAIEQVESIPFISATWAIFIIGSIMSAFTQIIQSRALRKNSPKRAYQKYVENQNRRISDDEIEDLIDVGQVHARRFNKSGMTKLRMLGLFAVAAWVTEGIVQALAVSWGLPWFSLYNLAVLARVVVLTFAFELLAVMDEGQD